MILKKVIHYPDNSIEATWTDAAGVQVKCHSYADVQMQMFRDDAAALGTPLTAYESLIALVEASIKPAPLPTDAQLREAAKGARAESVAAIKVTTAAGNVFDGDEVSQGRMARAIIGLSTGLAPSVTWVLANNSTIQATSAELTEALVLAGQAQAAVWVIA